MVSGGHDGHLATLMATKLTAYIKINAKMAVMAIRDHLRGLNIASINQGHHFLEIDAPHGILAFIFIIAGSLLAD